MHLTYGDPVRSAFTTGDWQVEPSSNLITRDDERTRLEPRVMHVLCVLTREPGRVVSRDDLIEEVWEGAHVSDDAVSAAIYQLRKALGDLPRSPRYVQTVPKRGYRWLETVGPVEAPGGPMAAGRGWPRWAVAATVLLVLGVGTVSAFALKKESPPLRHPSGVTVADPAFRSAFVRGWYLLNQRAPTQLPAALDEFRRAIEIDPDHPGAHAGLAAGYCMKADLGVGDLDDAEVAADRSLARAVAIDREVPEVQYALALRCLVFDLDAPTALEHLRRAVRADPTNPMFHGTMAWAHTARGDKDAAVASARRALVLDPTSMTSHFDLARLLAFDRRLDEAARTVQRALVLDPVSAEAMATQAWLLAHMNQPRASYRRYRRALMLSHAPARAVSAYDEAWRASGLVGTLAWRAADAQRRARTGIGGWLLSAQLRARAGDPAGALDDLEQALVNRERTLPFMLESPDFASIRQEPRFTAVVRRSRSFN